MPDLGPDAVAAQDELRARVATQIRAAAKRRGLAIMNLADQSGVSRAHLWAVLGGRRAPTTDIIARLALVLRVDPQELVRAPRKARAAK